uniref:FLZ-type domain-containing protein n=1 Tax=Solanum lycopersicum TaxID=4081 RepID=A0A3Q7FWP1_SOLLC
MNVGRKDILEGFRARSRMVVEKEAAATTTSLTHGFINSLQPCFLASSKPVPVMSLTPFTKCVNHGFAAYISLEEIQNSENYTRVVIHSPGYRVIHRYMDCELEFEEDVETLRNTLCQREEQQSHVHLVGYKEKYPPREIRRCKICKKSLENEEIFFHRDTEFCSSKCRSNDVVPYFEQRVPVKDPKKRPSGARKNDDGDDDDERSNKVEFFIGDRC